VLRRPRPRPLLRPGARLRLPDELHHALGHLLTPALGAAAAAVSCLYLSRARRPGLSSGGGRIRPRTVPGQRRGVQPVPPSSSEPAERSPTIGWPSSASVARIWHARRCA
jgi:hypothetical protein